MEDFHLMQSLKSFNNLNDDFPNMLFLHELLDVLAFTNSLKDISIIGELHNNAVDKKTKMIKNC